MRVALVGAGITGTAALMDLADDSLGTEVEAILLMDLDGSRAKRALDRASRLTNVKELLADEVDAKDPGAVSERLERFEADVVVNAAMYETIPGVMRAALMSGTHYLDLGDDVDTLLWQRSLDNEFRDRGLVALPEMGGSPGLINVMASLAASEMERVERILLREGWVDLNDYESLGIPLPIPYSLDTILDEMVQPVEVWEGGGIRYVEAMSGVEEMIFPEPVGTQRLYYVEHPEVYSLGETFRYKGLRFVDYKLSFPDDLVIKYRLLAKLGLASKEPRELNGCEVVPRELLRKLVSETLEGKEIPPNDYDVMVAIAEGWNGGTRIRIRVESRLRWSERWNVTAQALLVGAPAAVAARWIGRGLIGPGVHYPEEVIEPVGFLREVAERGFEFVLVRELVF